MSIHSFAIGTLTFKSNLLLVSAIEALQSAEHIIDYDGELFFANSGGTMFGDAIDPSGTELTFPSGCYYRNVSITLDKFLSEDISGDLFVMTTDDQPNILHWTSGNINKVNSADELASLSGLTDKASTDTLTLDCEQWEDKYEGDYSEHLDDLMLLALQRYSANKTKY